MGLMNRLFKRSSTTPALVGCWQLLQPADKPGEPAEADFRADGQLVYSVLSGDRWQIMKLLYKVDGDTIVTDQPSSPQKERTRFAFEAQEINKAAPPPLNGKALDGRIVSQEVRWRLVRNGQISQRQSWVPS